MPDDCLLVLKKRFFVSDDQIDSNDPMQVHLLYIQAPAFLLALS